jgi:hypothetical protein
VWSGGFLVCLGPQQTGADLIFGEDLLGDQRVAAAISRGQATDVSVLEAVNRSRLNYADTSPKTYSLS